LLTKRTPFEFIENAPPFIRGRVRGRSFAILIDLQHIAVIVLRDQQAPIFGPYHAFGVVARSRPDLFSFLPRRD
jgi:hypothetical protein